MKQNSQMILINENSFINRIKRFFKNLKNRLFLKKEKIQIVNNQSNNKKAQKDNFSDILKIEDDKIEILMKRKDFLEEIDHNYEALNMLSIPRLKKLSEYYDRIIEEKEKTLQKLKTENKS